MEMEEKIIDAVINFPEPYNQTSKEYKDINRCLRILSLNPGLVHLYFIFFTCTLWQRARTNTALCIIFLQYYWWCEGLYCSTERWTDEQTMFAVIPEHLSEEVKLKGSLPHKAIEIVIR